MPVEIELDFSHTYSADGTHMYFERVFVKPCRRRKCRKVHSGKFYRACSCLAVHSAENGVMLVALVPRHCAGVTVKTKNNVINISGSVSGHINYRDREHTERESRRIKYRIYLHGNCFAVKRFLKFTVLSWLKVIGQSTELGLVFRHRFAVVFNDEVVKVTPDAVSCFLFVNFTCRHDVNNVIVI